MAEICAANMKEVAQLETVMPLTGQKDRLSTTFSNSLKMKLSGSRLIKLPGPVPLQMDSQTWLLSELTHQKSKNSHVLIGDGINGGAINSLFTALGLEEEEKKERAVLTE